jgi:RNA 3'-terminal phosphate cyclase (ATP)
VNPSKIKSINLLERKSNNFKLVCTFSKISIKTIKEKIEKIKEKINVKIEIKEEEAIDSGASLLIYSIDNNSIMGIDALFNKKTQNFDLDLNKIIDNSLGLDEKLADMIVVPASLTKGKTVFRVKEITNHLETNLFVTSKITGCKYGIGKISEGFEVIIEGVSNSSIK